MATANQVVVITGAKGGLGNYVTEAFLRMGAMVVGVSRSIKDSDFPHPSFAAVAAELSSGEAARGLVETVMGRWGRMDAVVHLLGGFSGGPAVAETDDAALEKMLDLNFRSAFYLMRAALPCLRAQGHGRIVAIGSRAAVEPVAGLGVYSAAKAALVSLVKTVALENKDRGITANIVLPGTMDTPANRASSPGADYSRWVDPAQVAALVAHLASNEASHVSGAVIPVLGGEL